jgi:tetratricopeptide (TPR) repeat protein
MPEYGSARQPLDEARSSYERLQSYETPAELAEAVTAVWRAVERSLRLLVRADPEAPDELRLHVFTPATTSVDSVLTHLRRRDLVSLELAGMLHELERIVARIADGAVRAADGDAAARAFERLSREVDEVAATLPATQDEGDAAEPVAAGIDRGVPVAAGALADPGRVAGRPPNGEFTPSDADRRRTRRLMLFAGFVFLLGGVATLISVIRGPAALEDEAIAAFREEQFGIAERGFRIVLDRQPDNVNAMLYLGRIYRRQGRMNEASEILQAAVTRAPDDADVRRELGHLFNDLNRPAQAAEQFRRAVELDADEAANWIGLIQTLRAANDPAAEEWLQRAPANVRAALTRAPPQQPFDGS